ncbi:hypothetical protein ACTL6U_13405 [Rhodovibrionaceae bacterium A322]
MAAAADDKSTSPSGQTRVGSSLEQALRFGRIVDGPHSGRLAPGGAPSGGNSSRAHPSKGAAQGETRGNHQPDLIAGDGHEQGIPSDPQEGSAPLSLAPEQAFEERAQSASDLFNAMVDSQREQAVRSVETVLDQVWRTYGLK